MGGLHAGGVRGEAERRRVAGVRRARRAARRDAGGVAGELRGASAAAGPRAEGPRVSKAICASVRKPRRWYFALARFVCVNFDSLLPRFEPFCCVGQLLFGAPMQGKQEPCFLPEPINNTCNQQFHPLAHCFFPR